MKSKRIFTLMLALVMALSLAACGGGNTDTTTAASRRKLPLITPETAKQLAILRISAALSWLLLPGAGPRPVSRPWPLTSSPSTTAPLWWTPPAATATGSTS